MSTEKKPPKTAFGSLPKTQAELILTDVTNKYERAKKRIAFRDKIIKDYIDGMEQIYRMDSIEEVLGFVRKFQKDIQKRLKECP